MTSSSVPVIRLGTTIVLFARSSKLRRLLEMGVEMMRGEEYMQFIITNDLLFFEHEYHYFLQVFALVQERRVPIDWLFF